MAAFVIRLNTLFTIRFQLEGLECLRVYVTFDKRLQYRFCLSQTSQATALVGKMLILEPKRFFRDPPKHSRKRLIMSDLLSRLLESFPPLLPFG